VESCGRRTESAQWRRHFDRSPLRDVRRAHGRSRADRG